MQAADRTFSPGFRFSKLDAVVLFIGVCAAAETATVMPWLGVAIAFVVGHFFLFCNLVRMARPFELTWAGVFIALAAATILTGWPSWPVTFGVSLVLTVVLIFFAMRKPSYHGVFWRRINPELPQWWESQR